MQLEPLLDRMSAFPTLVEALVAPLSADDACWRPEEGGWSVLETVAHLMDEETVDFRRRLASTLEDPARAWDPIDPEGDVERLAYNSLDLQQVMTTLTTRRGESVAWLRSLRGPDWSRTHHHPKGWAISAGDLLLSWAAHDALHLRQLARRVFDLAKRDLPGSSTSYAGDW